MVKAPLDPNARKALDDLKFEIANELGISNSSPESVGSLMSKRIAERENKEIGNVPKDYREAIVLE